jgi:hypothetical protein
MTQSKDQSKDQTKEVKEIADQILEELPTDRTRAIGKSDVMQSLGWTSEDVSTEEWRLAIEYLKERFEVFQTGEKKGSKYYVKTEEDLELERLTSEIRDGGLNRKNLNRFFRLCGAEKVQYLSTYTHSDGESEVFIYRVHVGQEAACKIFGVIYNERNRNITSSRLNQYISDVESGNWYDNAMPVVVSKQLKIGDGNHRMNMRAMTSAESIPILFIIGIPKDHCFGFDENKVRSLGDHFQQGSGDREWAREMRKMSKFITQVLFLEQNATYGGNTSNTLKANSYDKFKKQFDLLKGEFPGVSITKGAPSYNLRRVSVSFLAAMVFASKKNGAKIKEFVRAVFDERQKGEHSSVTAMRQWLNGYIHEDDSSDEGVRAKAPASTVTRKQQAFAGFLALRRFLDGENLTFKEMIRHLGAVEVPKQELDREDYEFFQQATNKRRSNKQSGRPDSPAV